MPGRYEIVDEPVESLEVIDDEVYHPDLTVRDHPSSFRSLEPIISGPITLRTIFYDPRWSTNKRRCCLGFVLLTSLVCFSLMISLFVGLGKVLSYINESERLRETGLHMIPDLEQLEPGIFLYNSDKKYEYLQKKYFAELDAFLAKYKSQTKEYEQCSIDGQVGDGKLCHFDLNWLGTNCTSANGYGYTDGNPCVLFEFRNIKDWFPNITDAYLKSVKSGGDKFTEELRARMKSGQQFDQYHLPLTCSVSYTGPKPAEETTFRYYPESGFNLTFISDGTKKKQLPPLVFVQFLKPPTMPHPQSNVKCHVWAPNAAEFKGVRTIEFEFDNIADLQGSPLDGP